MLAKNQGKPGTVRDFFMISVQAREKSGKTWNSQGIFMIPIQTSEKSGKTNSLVHI